MRAFFGRVVAVAATLTLAGPVAASSAEEPKQEPAQVEEPRGETPKEPPAVVTAGKDGFTIQSEDGGFKLKLTGYAQADGRFYASDTSNDGVDTFVVRRVQPIVTGTVGKYFDFNVTPDFGSGAALVQDAFLDARFNPAFSVKAGKFKGPVGLERLASGAALTFVERGLPAGIAPNRDIGIQIHGEISKGVVYYQAGVFDGVVDGGSTEADTNDGKDLEGRLFFQPFKNGDSALKSFGFGIAGTTGKQVGAGPTYKTTGLLTFFSYGSTVTADGTRTRVAPQASYQSGPFRIFGEWVSSKQELRKSATGTLKATNKAWQGVASVVLSGEAPVAGVVTPRKPFDPGKGGWGALELAARYGELDLDDAVFTRGYADPAKSASKAKAWSVGANWHLTRNVKYVVNYDHTTFEGGAAGGKNRRAENAILLRAQVSF